ncbi:MAG: TlpA family protein disulfide reductase [Paramuribaculum sp.]|nr:TlpA family protein disulfide reductase [Paramuribaculum sp.]
MKRLSIFTLGAVTLLTLSSAAPRTVVAPEFESGYMNFRIAAVHLSDTATRINADIYTHPKYWVTADTNIYLASRITDNEYPVRRIEGMPLREHIYGGDSAHIRATFVFDPLAPSDTVFDFIERGGSWNVRGIDLNYKPTGMKTHLSGIINDRPTASWLLMIPHCKDTRVNKTVIIPVENGKFEYDLYTTDTVPYELIAGIEMLSGSWMYHLFFAEGEQVKFDFSENAGSMWENTQGGNNTRKLLDFYKNRQMIRDNSGLYQEREKLDSLKLYYTPEMYGIISRLREAATQEIRDSLYNILAEMRNQDKEYSPAGKEINARIDSLFRVLDEEKLAFIENDASLVGLTLIYKDMTFNDKNFERELDIYNRVYADRYPNHPLATEIKLHLADEKAEVGKHYPDFTAPDLQGNMRTLSDLIKDKFAVIDLWASWCGPCRRHSMEMIPVYEKWKDKGFTIVGIARENGDTQAMEGCIKTDGYPWLNLVELNDASNIWNKYNVANAGGKIVLVAPSGTVIAINPSAAEVDALLTKLIGNK